MRIAVYGGSFDPPHLGHRKLAETALEQLGPDRLIVLPAKDPPHKRLAPNSAPPEERLRLCRMAFGDLDRTEVSGLELGRTGPSYTVETLETLHREYPGAELILIVGTDMLVTLDRWYRAEDIFRLAGIAPLARECGGERDVLEASRSLSDRYGVRITPLSAPPVEVSSSEIRGMLPMRRGRRFLNREVYGEIARIRLYGMKPDLDWLRENAFPLQDPARLGHVRGCEETAAALAERWGADPDDAREAAICHDLTKRFDLSGQLKLCLEYGIIGDTLEMGDERLLHSITSAEMARRLFGCPPEIVSAIRWHTTGRKGMTLLDKIVCLADFIEPTRDFADLSEVRDLAYRDLDGALCASFEMTLASLGRRGIRPHGNTRAALEDLKARRDARAE